MTTTTLDAGRRRWPTPIAAVDGADVEGLPEPSRSSAATDAAGEDRRSS